MLQTIKDKYEIKDSKALLIVINKISRNKKITPHDLFAGYNLDYQNISSRIVKRTLSLFEKMKMKLIFQDNGQNLDKFIL